MTRYVFLIATLLTLVSAVLVGNSDSGGFSQQSCALQPPASCPPQGRSSGPECGIEMTCTAGPMQLGTSSGVCFRATCPGVWGILHQRTDQYSFRRRIFAYRHYAFRGYWDLKDQGVIESGPVRQRALFLVLPDDLIEFRLLEPDPYAQIEVRDLGYVKKGSMEELQNWLAYRVHIENLEATLLQMK